jgi:hypothetical protein
MDEEGSEEHPAGSKHYDANDPADWAEIVRLGFVWSLGEAEQKQAIDDLISGKLPMNDKIPQELRDFILEEQS